MEKNPLLTKTGKIKKKYKPAMYLDTSVVIDYWIAEGMGPRDLIEEDRRFEPEHFPVLRDLFKKEKRLVKLTEIRERFINGNTRVVPVVTPLSFLELAEWVAEGAFKQMASEAIGAIYIQRKSKKEIGGLLAKILELRREELEKLKDKNEKGLTGLELLVMETTLNMSFVESHGLGGIKFVDIVNYHFPFGTALSYPYLFAYLQLGVADTLHILLAKHLSCEYIASFDNDFARVKNIIAENTGIIVLTSPEEILSVL